MLHARRAANVADKTALTVKGNHFACLRRGCPMPNVPHVHLRKLGPRWWLVYAGAMGVAALVLAAAGLGFSAAIAVCAAGIGVWFYADEMEI